MSRQGRVAKISRDYREFSLDKDAFLLIMNG